MGAVVFWVALLVIVISYMTLWYGVSLVTNRLDVVDTAWGLGFILVAWVSLGLRANFGAVQLLSAVLVSVWGVRLSAHIASRNWRKREDDHRYQVLRQKWGGDNHKAYAHIFLLQGALLTFVSLPMAAIAFSHHQPDVFSYAGWVIWLFGISYEAVADWQLRNFITRHEKGSHGIMSRGLWRYSRHPNYFGELVTWWGATLVAISVRQWWGVFGALVITLLITKISGIPPLEKHYGGNKAYKAYRQRTSVLIPLPPKAKV